MGTVLACLPDEPLNPSSHESVTRMRIAAKIARLLGYALSCERDRSRVTGAIYVVPSQTVVGIDTARALGISSERDLFGGVVPHAFIATKTITHSLYDEHACAPQGWSPAFSRAVTDVVLRGYSAFGPEDARRAARALLADTGGVRVKAALGVGGRDQFVAEDTRAIDAAIAELDRDALRVSGVVIEENLAAPATYSVGRVIVGEHGASYVGTQQLTRDHAGTEVYGGSQLLFARGGFDALLELALPDDARRAVEQARVYDAAADTYFDGFMASRRNYDVALEGRSGRGRGGVLEQSWRIGGASGAEIAALEYFAADPEARAVRAACVEDYSGGVAPPGATVYFDGEDEKVGRILKYTTVTPNVDA